MPIDQKPVGCANSVRTLQSAVLRLVLAEKFIHSEFSLRCEVKTADLQLARECDLSRLFALPMNDLVDPLEGDPIASR
jgi:hypothetical protein